MSEKKYPVGEVRVYFVFKHPKTGEEMSSKLYTPLELLDTDLSIINERTCVCDCKPVGETNVVECNCEDYYQDFQFHSYQVELAQPGPMWVKASERLPAPGIYNAKKDGKPFVLRFMEADKRMPKEYWKGVEWLSESPAEQPVAYNELERHETRLALRLLLKVFKNDQISKEQEKFCSQAEAILKKYSKGKVIMRAKPSPWVPADTKPEHNVGVLVFIPGEDNHITSGMWDVENKWVLLDEYRTPEEEVTHWMPLPALPEGYKRDDKITDEWVRELKAIAKEELSKKDEQPVREVAIAFAEWLNSNFVSIENRDGEAVYVEYSPQEYEKKQQFKIAQLWELFKKERTAEWSGEKEGNNG